MPHHQLNLRTLFWWTAVVGLLTIGVKLSLPAFETICVRAWVVTDEWLD